MPSDRAQALVAFARVTAVFSPGIDSRRATGPATIGDGSHLGWLSHSGVLGVTGAALRGATAARHVGERCKRRATRGGIE